MTVYLVAVAFAAAVLSSLFARAMFWRRPAWAGRRRLVSWLIFLPFFVALTVALFPIALRWRSRQTVAEFMKQNTALTDLREEEPEAYERFLDRVDSAAEAGTTQAEVVRMTAMWARKRLTGAMQRRWMVASDNSVLGYYRAVLAILEPMSQTDARGCVGMVFGAPDSTWMPTHIDSTKMSDLVRAVSAVQQSAETTPRPVIPLRERIALRAILRARIAREAGPAVVRDLDSSEIADWRESNVARSCKAFVAWVHTALEYPPDSAGHILRGLNRAPPAAPRES